MQTFAEWVTASRRYSHLVRATLAPPISGGAAGSSLPTLTAKGNVLSPNMRKWPAHARLATLVAGDFRFPRTERQQQRGWKSRSLPEQLGGRLCPDFADWYQGFPLAWTRRSAFGLQATRRFRKWLRRHSLYFWPSLPALDPTPRKRYKL